MERKELLEKIGKVRSELAELSKLLAEMDMTLFTEKSPFKTGDDVEMYGRKYRIIGQKMRFSTPEHCGRLIKKDGQLGLDTFNLYGKLTLITKGENHGT